jgi:MFS family permease
MWQFISDKKSSDFFRFWFAQLMTQFGDRIFQMALVGLMAARHPGSVAEMSKLFVFAIIPAFIVGPVAGVYIDRWDRRTVLFVCYFLQGMLVLLAAFYLIRMPNIWPMYGVVFLIFSLSRFYVPAKMSFIPEMVHPNDLLVANSLSSITGMIALLGAPLGGLIVEDSGSFGGFSWDAVCYLFSGILVVSIAALRHRLPNKTAIIAGTKAMLRSQKTVWHEILDGIRYIRAQKEIRFIFWMMAILCAAAGAIYVVIIVFIQQAFHSVTKDLGFLTVPLTFGLILGSLTYGRWGQRIAAYKIIFWSLILGGAVVIVFVSMVNATHSRPVALGLSLVLGFVLGPVMIAPNTVINKICAREMSGKVFAALEFVVYLPFLLAMMISSFLSEHLPLLWILITVGGIFVVVGIVGLIGFKPDHSLEGETS